MGRNFSCPATGLLNFVQPIPILFNLLRGRKQGVWETLSHSLTPVDETTDQIFTHIDDVEFQEYLISSSPLIYPLGYHQTFSLSN